MFLKPKKLIENSGLRYLPQAHRDLIPGDKPQICFQPVL